MKKIVSFLVMLTILVSFASCGSDQKQEEIKVEKPDAVNTVAKIQEKPKKEQTTDYTKLFKSTINFEMEPIIREEIPNKPQKLYFNQLGCEWVKDIHGVLDIEGQYAWVQDVGVFTGNFINLYCIDLRSDKIMWQFDYSGCSNYKILDDQKNEIAPMTVEHISYIQPDSGFFIIVITYYGIGGEKTIFGPVDKYSGELLWAKYEHQRIDNFKIMNVANKFVYQKMDGTEVFITLDLTTGKELFSTKLETKLFTIDYNQDFHYSSNLEISYFSANNHLILFSSTREKIDTSEGKGYGCNIYHIPTEKGQIFWKISYIEKTDIYKIIKPRLLNDYLVIPNYSESKAYFLNYKDGTFIYKNNAKLFLHINDSFSIFEKKNIIFIDNGNVLSRFDDADFSKPVWELDKNNTQMFMYELIFNDNLLLTRCNKKDIESFICLDVSNGTIIWETKVKIEGESIPINKMIYSNYVKIYSNNTIINTMFIDTYFIINNSIIDLNSGIKENISCDFNYHDIRNKIFGYFEYCNSSYLVKYDLPTDDKVLVYPPIVNMSADNRLNELDQKYIIFINTTDKPIDFKLELLNGNWGDSENKFNKFISISSNILTVKPFSKSFITVKEIKETKTKNTFDAIVLMKWLKIIYNNEERKIMIKVNDPQCDI